MVKIINKQASPVSVTDIPVGECFIYNGEVYMRVRLDRRYASLRMSSGVVQTNFHDDTRVLPVNVTIEVG